MHGRVKTLTTEEQKIKQQKVRAAKVIFYNTTISRIFEKRENKEYDDEAQALIGDVLMSNPDVNSLWNYKREMFLAKKSKLEANEMEEFFKKEMSLTEQCLRVNPKSYCTWHYRVWILDNMEGDFWPKEVDLCNKYLSLDERNFHCWDYRKLVAERANVPPISEYKFTTEKIESNFSNYSAWHLRSKLLPIIFEDPTRIFPVAEDKHKEELDLVQNAAFTDPDDQSAWFYLRWLLNLRSPSAKFICIHPSTEEAVVALSKEVCLGDINRMDVYVGQDVVEGKWTSPTEARASSVWTFHFDKQISPNSTISIKLLHKSKEDDSITTNLVPTFKETSFSPPYSDAVKETLMEQLQSCRDLLELEPDSKWTLLTAVFLLKSLDLRIYDAEIDTYLKKLVVVDPLRSGYYSDLTSQLIIEQKLNQEPFPSTFRLLNSNLTCLCHTQYLVLTKFIDLSGNKLKSNQLPYLSSLVFCSELTLDNNQIESLELMPVLKRLEKISLKNNPLKSNQDNDDFLKKLLPALQSVIL